MELDAVNRERTRLVGAEAGDTSEVLYSVEALDDHVLLAHGDGALCEVGVDDDGEHLGCETDCNSDCEEECILWEGNRSVRCLMRVTSRHSRSIQHSC